MACTYTRHLHVIVQHDNLASSYHCALHLSHLPLFSVVTGIQVTVLFYWFVSLFICFTQLLIRIFIVIFVFLSHETLEVIPVCRNVSFLVYSSVAESSDLNMSEIYGYCSGVMQVRSMCFVSGLIHPQVMTTRVRKVKKTRTWYYSPFHIPLHFVFFHREKKNLHTCEILIVTWKYSLALRCQWNVRPLKVRKTGSVPFTYSCYWGSVFARRALYHSLR